MIDERTALGILLPHPGNALEEDIIRLRQALAQIDTALAARQLTSERGAANGYAPLVGGFVPSIYLPSFVDDVIEVANFSALPAVGEAGKIYVTLAAINISGTNYPANRQYRWGGSAYVEVSSSPGTTDDVVEGAVNKYFSDPRAQTAAKALLATQAEAEAGTAADKFMSPVRVAQAISKRAIGPGDIVLSARALSAPDWLPADGSVYSKSSYPALAAELGAIPPENAGVASGYAAAGSYSSDTSNLAMQKIATNGSGVWICTGAAGYYIAKSTNLNTWGNTLVHLLPGVNCQNVAFGNGRFVITTSSTATNKVYVSTDNGATWTGNTAVGLTAPSDFYWLEFLPTAGLFVGQYFTGSDFRVATSPDGVSWTNRGGITSFSITRNATYVASDGYLYVGDFSGRIARTNNGAIWTVVNNSNDAKQVSAFFEIGGYIIAVGAGGYCYRSSNGTIWTAFTSPFLPGASINCAAAANGLAVISSGSPAANNAYVSYDGLTWSLVTVAIGTSFAIRRMQGIGSQIIIMCDDNSGTVYVQKHPGFSYNTATQFITPYKNFLNQSAEFLNAYVKA